MKHCSYSQLRLYQECPRKYYYKYILGNYPKKSLALLFGSAIHSALEVYYNGGTLREMENIFIKEMSDTKDLELKGRESVEKEAGSGLNMLRMYVKSPDKPVLKPKYVEYKAEVILKHPITKKPLDVPMKLIMDVITEDDLIVDHKTVGGKMWSEEQLDTDMQSVLYWMAFEELFGKEPRAFMFNFLFKNRYEPRFDAQALEVGKGKQVYFIEYAESIIKNIQAENFQQKIGGQCRYCPNRILCL